MAEWRNTTQCRLTWSPHGLSRPLGSALATLAFLWFLMPACSGVPPGLCASSARAWSIFSFLPHCCNLFFPTMSAQMPLPQERLCFTCFTKRPNSPATGIRRFTMLCFTAFHRCCALLQTEGMPCRQQKNYNSLYCDTRLIAAVWN